MSYQEVLLGLLPPVSYARGAQRIRQQAQIDARVLDEVARRADEAAGACLPETSGAMLTDWERVLGLEATNAGKPYTARLAAVLLKINAVGGLSIPYFIQLSQSAGYTITIDEPQPFRVGINRAGDRLAPEEIMWVWVVNVAANTQTVWRFRAGASCAGERLSVYGDSVIETVFEDLKPAHTAVRFTYKD